MLDFLVYGLLGAGIVILMFFIIIDLMIIIGIDLEKTSEYMGYFFVLWISGFIVFDIIYMNLYHEMHGKYTKLFKSDEVIQKEETEKRQQIASEILNKATLETSYTWKYLDDYNEYVQSDAIDKLKQFKHIHKVKNRFIEIGTNGYQSLSVRNNALCAIQDEIIYSGIIEDVINSWGVDSDEFSSKIFSYCLTDENIKQSSSLRKVFINKYHTREYIRNIRIALKYEEDIRREYADYLLDRTSFYRFFNKKAWGNYFSNEDLLGVINVLSSRELILGDKYVKEALVDVLKMKDSKIIKQASEALRRAYNWNDEILNILASHLSSDNENIRHEAIYALEKFYATNEPSVVSRIIPMLDDTSSWNRKLAIETLKPLFNNYSKTKKLNDEKSRLIVKAYNKIVELSKYDLDEDVRNKARYTTSK